MCYFILNRWCVPVFGLDIVQIENLLKLLISVLGNFGRRERKLLLWQILRSAYFTIHNRLRDYFGRILIWNNLKPI